MKINANFDERVVVHSEAMEWVASPMPGVSRRPLDRVGDEVARATSIVKYVPESEFSPHVHTGGEEFIVLEGVFQDEHGDFPAGSYIRNPPTSKHKPGSDDGCIIFVKLWQFEPEDRTSIFVKPDEIAAAPHKDIVGVSVVPLFKNNLEEVSIEYWDPNTEINMKTPEGAELLVLEGEVLESDDRLLKYSWLRVPAGGVIKAKAGTEGAKIWVKKGNLDKVDIQIGRLPVA